MFGEDWKRKGTTVKESNEQLAEIGRKSGLLHGKARDLRDFVKFFNLAFPHHTSAKGFLDIGYAETWAERFEKNTEWEHADFERRRVLKKVNLKKYGKDIHSVFPLWKKKLPKSVQWRYM